MQATIALAPHACAVDARDRQRAEKNRAQARESWLCGCLLRHVNRHGPVAFNVVRQGGDWWFETLAGLLTGSELTQRPGAAADGDAA